eukprot:TRINITY_DN1123_c0_g1_i1.p1 TRINITY_DN1123_c0_g1~~TRINITY_DN1123_c0_g1_i1.p1  ORF type:complete len:485 (+),score=83.83 TRINITY_DN1123_c0_g1_i1:39-1493(+)
MYVRQVRHLTTVVYHAEFEKNLLEMKPGGIREIIANPISAKDVQPLPTTKYGMRMSENDTLGQALVQFGLGITTKPEHEHRRKSSEQIRLDKTPDECLDDIKEFIKPYMLDAPASFGESYPGFQEILDTARKARHASKEQKLKPNKVQHTTLSEPGFSIPPDLLSEDAVSKRLAELKTAAPVSKKRLRPGLVMSKTVPTATPLVDHPIFKVPVESNRSEDKFQQILQRFGNQTKKPHNRPVRDPSAKEELGELFEKVPDVDTTNNTPRESQPPPQHSSEKQAADGSNSQKGSSDTTPDPSTMISREVNVTEGSDDNSDVDSVKKDNSYIPEDSDTELEMGAATNSPPDTPSVGVSLESELPEDSDGEITNPVLRESELPDGDISGNTNTATSISRELELPEDSDGEVSETPNTATSISLESELPEDSDGDTPETTNPAAVLRESDLPDGYSGNTNTATSTSFESELPEDSDGGTDFVEPEKVTK